MKKIKQYNEFINEGKISKFLLKTITYSIGFLKLLSQKIKGTYIKGVEFKDKNVEKRVTKNIFLLLDYVIFDTIKYYLFKKYRENAEKTNLSTLIKSRSGVDVYQLSDSIIDDMKDENLIFSDDTKINEYQKKKAEENIGVAKQMISLIKKIDDDILELQELKKEFQELADYMKKYLDPRDAHKRDKDEVIGALEGGLGIIDKMNQPKEMDDILDKVKKFGMHSLTDKEKENLDNYSKSI